MVSRSLFEVFLLMRNNALQSRHLYTSTKQNKNRARQGGADRFLSEDRVALVSDQDNDHFGGGDDDEEQRDFMAEQVGSALRYRRIQNLPPEWVEIIDEVNGQIEVIQRKVKELKTSHDKVIRRPAFDDDEADTSRELEGATQEITQLFHKCHARIGAITKQAQTARARSERKLAENAALRLNRTLQEVSVEFKVAQVNYLKQLQARQERSQLFLSTGSVQPGQQSGATSIPKSVSSTFPKPTAATSSKNILLDDDNDENVLLMRGGGPSGMTAESGMGQSQSFQSLAQVQVSASNVELAQARDQEIDRIVRSIEELNSIFKDVSVLIHDQGTVLDRIDHNIQQTSVKVESAHKSLVKAERMQKSNRKMMIIFALTCIVVFLVVILILVKLSR